MNAQILGIEYVFPSKKISNQDLVSKFPDYNFDKFESKVGIINRYRVEDNQTALDLAELASVKLLKRFKNVDVDYILYCTQSPEYLLPSSSCILQDRLKLSKNIGSLDFSLGCSGYTYGISLAKGLIESKQAQNILLVTTETYSKYIHDDDRANQAIFGDASTATLISSDSNSCGIHEFLFGTDGSGFDKIIVRNGGGKHPTDLDPDLKYYGSNNSYTDNNLYMNGPKVFHFTHKIIPNFTEEVLIKNELKKEDIDQFVFHQANSFLLNFLRKMMKIPTHNFFNNLIDGGNTVSNSIPIALKRYSENSSIKSSKKILLMGFGVGLSWCGGVITINQNL